MLTAVYFSNRDPHAALANATPYKTIYDKDAHLGHLRAIGAKASMHVEAHTTKPGRRAWEGRLVGYSVDSKSIRVDNPETRSCLLYTSPSPRDLSTSRMPSSA